jgi:predicted nucleotidyltransferase
MPNAETILAIIEHDSLESRVRGKLASAVRRGADGKGSGNRDLAGGLPDSEGRGRQQCQPPYPARPSKTEETKGMPLPQLNRAGELPEGVHQATIDEVIAQFGSGTSQRQAVTARLRRIYHLARATRKLERLILFGSYITAKHDPNDIDIILVMRDDFDVHACDEESQKLFDHPRAAETFGASVFWIRPALLVLERLRSLSRTGR